MNRRKFLGRSFGAMTALIAPQQVMATVETPFNNWAFIMHRAVHNGLVFDAGLVVGNPAIYANGKDDNIALLAVFHAKNNPKQIYLFGGDEVQGTLITDGEGFNADRMAEHADIVIPSPIDWCKRSSKPFFNSQTRIASQKIILSENYNIFDTTKEEAMGEKRRNKDLAGLLPQNDAVLTQGKTAQAESYILFLNNKTGEWDISRYISFVKLDTSKRKTKKDEFLMDMACPIFSGKNSTQDPAAFARWFGDQFNNENGPTGLVPKMEA